MPMDDERGDGNPPTHMSARANQLHLYFLSVAEISCLSVSVVDECGPIFTLPRLGRVDLK